MDIRAETSEGICKETPIVESVSYTVVRYLPELSYAPAAP